MPKVMYNVAMYPGCGDEHQETAAQFREVLFYVQDQSDGEVLPVVECIRNANGELTEICTLQNFLYGGGLPVRTHETWSGINGFTVIPLPETVKSDHQ